MAGSGVITRKDIITDEALQWGSEYGKQVEVAIAKNNEMLEAVKALNKLMSEFKDIKTYREFVKIQEESVKASQKTEEAAQKREEAIQKAQEKRRLAEIRLQQQREKAFDKYEKDLKRQEEAEKKMILRQAKMEEPYNKLAAALNNTRNQAKNVMAQMFSLEQQGKKNTAEYNKLRIASVALATQTRILDKGIKDIDKSLGQHQREVGHYAIATQNLIPIFGRVDSQLASMGLSLDSLAKQPNPFKTLTAGIANFGKATLTFLVSPIGIALTALGGLFALIRGNKDTVIEFNSGLINVGKTANLEGQELSKFGDEVIKLSRSLETVSTKELTEFAAVAGQLGVKGTENLLKFTRAMAMLETASNISGEQGAAEIARLLTLTDGGVQNIQAFGDEIVILGNNFAATEKEILSNATSIAQSTGVYKLGRQEVLAYATATKAVGSEAQVTGSVIGRTLGVIEKAIRTGQNIDTIAKLTGQSVAELKSAFRDNSGQVLTQFVAGLNAVDNAGGSVNAQLEQLGITGQQDLRVLGSLATGGFETLANAMDKVTEAQGSLSTEFENGQQKLENQLKRVSIAWKNLVLSVENGEGIFSQLAVFFSGQLADAIEKVSVVINEISLAWKVIGDYLDDLFPKTKETEKGFLSMAKALFSVETYTLAVRNGFRALVKLFVVDIPNGIIKAKAGFDIFKNSISGVFDLIKAVAPEIKQYLLDFINPFKEADPSKILAEANKSLKKTFGENEKIIQEANQKALANQEKFAERYKKAQDDIANEQAEALKRRNEREVDVEDPVDDNKRKEYLSKLKKLADEEFALNQFRLKNIIETNKLIVNNDKETLENRTNALLVASEAEKELNRQAVEKKLKDISWYNDEVRNLTQEEINILLSGGNIKKTLNSSEILALEEYNAQKLAIEQKYNDDLEKEIVKELNIRKKALASRLTEQSTAESRDIEKLNLQYAEDLRNFQGTEEQKLALVERYEARKQEIQNSYLRGRIQKEIEHTEELLRLAGLAPEEEIKLQNELQKFKEQLSELDVQQEKETTDKKIALQKEYYQRVKELAIEFSFAIADLVNTIFDARIANIDAEISRWRDYYNEQIELAEGNERQQEYLREESKKKEDELNKKKRQEQRRQAIFNKIMNVANITQQTATATIAALAPPPVGLGPVFGGALIPFITALGALQIATVLATPIPAYEFGTDNHPGGYALVGEKRAEVIEEPGEKPYMVDKPTILNLKKGTKVTPSLSEYEKIQRAAIMASLDLEMNKYRRYEANKAFTDRYMQEMIYELKQNTKAVKNNKTNVVVYPQKIDLPHGFWKNNNIN